VKSSFEIVDPHRRQARVTLRAPLSNCPAPDACPARAAAKLDAATAEAAWPENAPITPADSDYIYPLFRALSQTVIEGYWIDYSTPGVLEDSVPLLAGQTVYADHHFWNVEKWLGVVNQASWDPDGAQSDGVPGINVELKIDAVLNPRIARGLLMQPPAIHSASVTVLFEYEYSHPDLLDDGRFWDLLGEEVEDETVRLIATKILGYWELSLVFQGADRSAKQLPSAAPAVAEQEQGVAPESAELATGAGLRSLTGFVTSTPSRNLTPAPVGERAQQAAADAGQKLLDAARAECRRLASVAMLGAEEGELPSAIRALIDLTDANQLLELTEAFREQTTRKYFAARSSVETPPLTAESERNVGDTTLL
jgi:hypothetical protein